MRKNYISSVRKARKIRNDFNQSKTINILFVYTVFHSKLTVIFGQCANIFYANFNFDQI